VLDGQGGQVRIQHAELLDQASYDEPTGRRLHIVLAELGQLCGWTAYDDGQQGLVQRYYVTAPHAAHSAEPAAGCAHPQLHGPAGSPPGATLRGRDTHRDRPGGSAWPQTPQLLAELHIRQACALAAVNDVSACTAAASQTREYVEPQEYDPPWLYWASQADITSVAASACCGWGRPTKR
jgi:hypothetical protein